MIGRKSTALHIAAKARVLGSLSAHDQIPTTLRTARLCGEQGAGTQNRTAPVEAATTAEPNASGK